MSFSHKRHLQEGISCKDCHKRAEHGLHATFPSIKVCLLCHKEAQGEHPDEPKIREYAQAGRQIPWQQVGRLPGHVYFSHADHVRYAKMDCHECHGEMKEQDEAITLPRVGEFDMDWCMACHWDKDVSNDCLSCHK